MKTYTKTIEVTKPRLTIQYDKYHSSPRKWSNLGYFITCDRNDYSPDKHPEYEEIIKETGQKARSQEEHIKMIKKAIQATGEKVLAIYPISKYEHSGVAYSLGTKHGFDYSNNGFYIVTETSQKEIGTPKKSFEKVIKEELDIYNAYANGEVYGYTLYDEQGNDIDSCWEFYSIDEIKEHLPSEWKNEELENYFIGE